MPWTSPVLIYIDDLTNTIQVTHPCTLITLTYVTCPVIFQIWNQQLIQDIQLFDSWLKGNKLSLNLTKTKSMLICIKSR